MQATEGAASSRRYRGFSRHRIFRATVWAVSVGMLAATAQLLAGCSAADTSTSDVGRTFEEGITGHGQIVDPDEASGNAGNGPTATQAKP